MAAFRSCLLFFLLAVAGSARAQTPEPLTLEKVLTQAAALAVQPPAVVWRPRGHDATVVLTAEDGSQTLHAMKDGKVVDEPLASAAALRSAAGGPDQGPAQFPAMSWIDDQRLRVQLGDQIAHWRATENKLDVALRWPGSASVVAPAPDDAHVAFVLDAQLHVRGADGRSRQLTFDGSADIVYGGAAHRAEFGITAGLFWSDDGRYLAFYREDQRPIAAYPYQDLDAMPPAPRHGRYPMAGRPHSIVRVGVFDTRSGNLQWLRDDEALDVYWTNITFGPDETVWVARVDRGQSQLELVSYSCADGARQRTVLNEQDPQWIEPEHGPTFLADGRFVWWSSRSGHRHLWLHGKDGKPVGEITKGAFDVQQLLRVTDDGKVWFQASGEDPRQLHVFVTDLAGEETRQVTRERGTHRATLSPDATVADVVWSNLETPPSARLLNLADSAVTALPPTRNPALQFTLPTQRMFQVKADDGTVLYGHLALPPNLAEGQKVPVLHYVYGGPHVQLVTDQWLGGAPLWLQAFAAEGIAVCRLDNRGTPNRGIQFEQAVHRRLGTLEVQDQLRAVEWLSQQPFVDPARIGVHGWSFGGYMTLRLMLLSPQTFACGVSGAGVTDWRMYETGYTERYMDTPAENEAGYEASSCLPLAGQLQRPLLVVQGTDDETVMWSHTLAFVDRCIDAGTFVDYLPYPMQKHGFRGADRAHFLRYLKLYLDRHLLAK